MACNDGLLLKRLLCVGDWFRRGGARVAKWCQLPVRTSAATSGTDWATIPWYKKRKKIKKREKRRDELATSGRSLPPGNSCLSPFAGVGRWREERINFTPGNYTYKRRSAKFCDTFSDAMNSRARQAKNRNKKKMPDQSLLRSCRDRCLAHVRSLRSVARVSVILIQRFVENLSSGFIRLLLSSSRNQRQGRERTSSGHSEVLLRTPGKLKSKKSILAPLQGPPDHSIRASQWPGSDVKNMSVLLKCFKKLLKSSSSSYSWDK